MIVAVVGSRNLRVDNLGAYLPEDTTEIVSGGARGVDTSARFFAKKHKIPLREILPDYNTFGRGAPIKRNVDIVNYADTVIAFWDGESRGTKFVIDFCKKRNVPIKVYYSVKK